MVHSGPGRREALRPVAGTAKPRLSRVEGRGFGLGGLVHHLRSIVAGFANQCTSAGHRSSTVSMLEIMQRKFRVGPVFVLSLLLVGASGCAGSQDQSEEVSSESATPAVVDANADACKDIEQLWADVEAWGTTPGNTDSTGAPVDGVVAPDFRLELDTIRQSTTGTLRTAFDEYFEEVPASGGWWFTNGIHEYGYGSGVQSACAAEDAKVDFPS